MVGLGLWELVIIAIVGLLIAVVVGAVIIAALGGRGRAP